MKSHCERSEEERITRRNRGTLILTWSAIHLRRQNIVQKSHPHFFPAQYLQRKRNLITRFHMQQALAEARGLKATSSVVYLMRSDGHYPVLDWQNKGEIYANWSSLREAKERKPDLELVRRYGCDHSGHYIAEYPVVICFNCNGEGYRTPECPWNPMAKSLPPLLYRVTVKREGLEYSKTSAGTTQPEVPMHNEGKKHDLINLLQVNIIVVALYRSFL